MSNWRSNRQQGWNKGLFRDSDKGWLAGVSHGMANATGFPVGLVRVAWFVAFVYLNMLAVFIYVAAWVLLEDQPSDQRKKKKKHQEPPVASDHSHLSESDILQRACRKAADIEQRLQQMESEVTSRRYRLRREFEQL